MLQLLLTNKIHITGVEPRYTNRRYQNKLKLINSHIFLNAPGFIAPGEQRCTSFA